jgi:protein-L-isoaspartate(D-aspartate) O-methyltransferase
MSPDRIYSDSFQHKGMRRILIDILREKGISDEAVLDAMNKIPRHYFLDSAFDKIAYENRAFPIAADQTISHPYTVAYQTQLLQVKKGDKVLEIGTGSIYQTTILAEMGAQSVFTIERQKKLYEEQKLFFFFRKQYPNIKFFYGDGFQGLPTYGPFDKIIITAAAPFIPPKLIEQLKPGGCMVVPVDEGEVQRMLRINKLEDGSILEESFEEFSFVPMLTGKNQ